MVGASANDTQLKEELDRSESEVREAQLRLQNAIAAKEALAARTQSAHADHAKVTQVTSNTQIQSEKKQNSEVQSVYELETQTRVVNKQNFVAKSVNKDGIQAVNKPKPKSFKTSEIVGSRETTAKEDNARTDSINAGHADALDQSGAQSVVELIKHKNTPTEVIDEANQLEKELAKSVVELREAQMKFIHSSELGLDKVIIEEDEEEEQLESSDSDIVHKPTIQVWQAKSAKTDEEEEKSLNLDNMEDNTVGASDDDTQLKEELDRSESEVREAQLRLKNAIAAKEALAARTQSAHVDHAKVTQVTSNTQIQSEKKQNSEAQSVSELETQTRVVNKQNFVDKSFKTSETAGSRETTTKEDNARTDSINAGHADDLISLVLSPWLN
ncbi:uncharacterized protein LOC113316040 [Papaver somniferum]|uniref:uncharacterized protein LOC113316040 n=1 Tax=Papaver somniferum TaxID=3469 RepID=UPI000E6FC586|nr:uncharacterized protein LOC113316040 [Papaver somniferum]